MTLRSRFRKLAKNYSFVDTEESIIFMEEEIRKAEKRGAQKEWLNYWDSFSKSQIEYAKVKKPKGKKNIRNETLDELLKKSSGGNWRRVAEQMKTK